MLKVGDYVKRKKYGGDIVFVISNIEKGIYYLKGADTRILADTKEADLIKVENYKKKVNF